MNALDSNRALPQYALNHWDCEQGLPQSSVFAVVQTSDGFLWLGTGEGLVRFDGAAFQVFDSGNTPAIINNHVNVLLAEADGSLWIGTNTELVRHRAGEFRAFGRADGLSDMPILALTRARDGVLWVGGAKGVMRSVGERFEAIDHGLRLACASIGCACRFVRVSRRWVLSHK